MSKKILYIVNDINFFVSHRLEIALAAKKEGFQVHVAYPRSDSKFTNKLRGFKHHLINLSRSGRNPLKEIYTFFSIFRLIKDVNPDLLHLITIKPVIYGGIISSILKTHGVVSAVPGLGYSFINKGMKATLFRFLISLLYKLAFNKDSLRVIFQNDDDKATLEKLTKLDISKIALMKGSGVDLKKFSFSALPKGKPIISMVSRLQRDKGVFEFFKAAKILRERKKEIEFQFIGELDVFYASKIDQEEFSKWKETDYVKFLGFRSDIYDLFKDSTIIVLPSYREGFPKVLQEAAACGRPIITSDVPGCREAIKEGKSGYLVEPRSATALADKIQELVEDKELLQKMGYEGRKLAEEEFSVNKIVSQHLKLYYELLQS
tara:strand:- start:3990 stop:5117 length:1128 start_codon:yes stop_codon:yes gene_type:complete